MKMTSSTLIALAVSAGMFTSAASAITGTTSVSGTFTSTVEVGTCTAQVQNAAGTAISTLAFGDVYKSDLTAQSRSEPFKIAFSGCAGVKSASVETTKGTGGNCSGDAKDGDSFDAGNAAAFEVWKGTAGSGTLLSCKTTSKQNVTISSGTGTMDLAARIVIAKGKTISNVTTGNVSAPVTFVVTYQ